MMKTSGKKMAGLFAALVALAGFSAGCTEQQQLRSEKEDVREAQEDLNEAKRDANENVGEAARDANDDIQDKREQLDEEKQDVRDELNDDARTTTPATDAPNVSIDTPRTKVDVDVDRNP